MNATDAATWPRGSLFSPVCGLPLQASGSSKLVCDGEVWPVIEGIPFLRADRIDMAREAVGRIEAGDILGATALLLTDQDGYAPDPPPRVEDCAGLVREAATLTFRTAMQRLAFGRVADYFAHRWSDPTYISGLALFAETGNAAAPGPVLELASGTGHFLRAFALAGIEAAGGDLVFAKLWLARRFICPQARLACFDASASWPFAAGMFATVFCHDAFYFLPDKPQIAARMRHVLRGGGSIAIGHAHNASVDNHSKGAPLTVDGYAALLPGARLFDDRELTSAFAEARPPQSAEAATLASVPALSMVWHDGGSPAPAQPAQPGFGTETAGTRLRRNPLYEPRPGTGTTHIVWPSPRYQQEYADLKTYPDSWSGPACIDASDDAETLALLRRRVYLDLPAQW